MAQFQCKVLDESEGWGRCSLTLKTDGNDGDTGARSKSNKTLSYKFKCLKRELKNSLFSPIISWMGGWVYFIL